MRIRGKALDGETRCIHQDGQRDIVAVRLPCCDGFWPCARCHDEEADHPLVAWRGRHHEAAVLCGDCGHVDSVAAYLAAPEACGRCGEPRGAVEARFFA